MVKASDLAVVVACCDFANSAQLISQVIFPYLSQSDSRTLHPQHYIDWGKAFDFLTMIVIHINACHIFGLHPNPSQTIGCKIIPYMRNWGEWFAGFNFVLSKTISSYTYTFLYLLAGFGLCRVLLYLLYIFTSILAMEISFTNGLLEIVQEVGTVVAKVKNISRIS